MNAIVLKTNDQRQKRIITGLFFFFFFHCFSNLGQMLEQILCADSPWTAFTSLQGIVEEEEDRQQQQQQQHTELRSLTDLCKASHPSKTSMNHLWEPKYLCRRFIKGRESDIIQAWSFLFKIR